MTGHLRVVTPGLATTVQDIGRRGFQRLGIPVAGALDAEALTIANLVVGNSPDAAALECLYQGPTLVVVAAMVRVALVGPGAALEIEIEGQRRRVPSAQSVTLPRETSVRVVFLAPAISAVLAVAGGIAVPVVMGSRSTFARAKLGGFKGRTLRAGDLLPLGTAKLDGPEQRIDAVLSYPTTIRVVLGPQDDYFSDQSIAAFLSTPYTITTAADRMGQRLSGAKLGGYKGFNITSDSVPPGAIQVPGDGQPIILLADRQTTGGYPKIATVISADIPSLGRVGPGAVLRFARVTVAEAETAAREAAHTRANWHLLPVGRDSIDEARLHDSNLISGVVSGEEHTDIS
jgi:biotin-dependent carboxylase-like uncharacterized protein